MKILFLGDIMGRSGRDAVTRVVPKLREQWHLDFVVANGENATNGMGLSAAHAKLLLESGIDVITLGDHAFDQRDMMPFVDQEQRIIRPLNLAEPCPGVGARVFDAPGGRKVMVAQALGQVFMKQPFANPFSALDSALRATPLGGAVSAVIVDFHAEATSEAMGMGFFLNGRASLVVGTHTHIPTADTQILSKGTAYQSDAGMCGDYDSVIGMHKEEPLRRFMTGLAKDRFSTADGEATLCGIYVETDDKSGEAVVASPVRQGGKLSQMGPPV
ncbi:MAG: TIGR00282 family metallophosphoesterase [Pseudomonadota bacterium]